MKAETPGHIKTKKLKMILKLPLYQVAGILELLWNFAVNCADDGAVGRYSNEDIAAYIEYDGDPDALVAALVHCRWLDEHPVHRLVVHDWEEERPYFVEERIRKREDRAEAKRRRTRPPESHENNGRVQEDAGRVRQNDGQSDPTKPNQTNSNPTKPNSIEQRLSLDAIEGLNQTVGEIFRKTGYAGKDSLTFWKTAHLMKSGAIPWDIVETVAALTRSNSSENPPAYFRRTLVKECKAKGIDAESLLGAVRLPKHFDRGPPVMAGTDSSVLDLVNALSRKDSP